MNRVIQMPECWLIWPVSINAHSPTEEERQHAREHLEKLVSDSDARKKNREEIDEDSRKSASLLKMLPDAFLFTRDGKEGNSIRLTFRPNPNYKPSSNEAKVFHNMHGVLLINANQTRLAKLRGELISDVDFGFGILGKLQKGAALKWCSRRWPHGPGRCRRSMCTSRVERYFFTPSANSNTRSGANLNPCPLA